MLYNIFIYMFRNSDTSWYIPLMKNDNSPLGVKPQIHQSELKTYTKVVPFKEKSSFHFDVLWEILNGIE